MKKKFKNHEIISIIQKIKKSADHDENFPGSAARIPFSVQWKKKLNLKEMLKIQEMVSEEEQKIDAYYLDDEHSYPAKGKNGEDMRRIKNAYVAEFSRKKSELYNAETDVEIRTISPGELSETMLTDLQMDALMFMIEENESAGRS